MPAYKLHICIRYAQTLNKILVHINIDTSTNVRFVLHTLHITSSMTWLETSCMFCTHYILLPGLIFFQDDVISATDLDKLMPHGLGLRYAFLGALETSYLNANGTFVFWIVFYRSVFRLAFVSFSYCTICKQNVILKLRHIILVLIPYDYCSFVVLCLVI